MAVSALFLLRNAARRLSSTVQKRFKSDKSNTVTTGCAESQSGRALVLGVYHDQEDPDDVSFRFTHVAEGYNSTVHNRLYELLTISGSSPGAGAVRVFYNLDPRYSAVAVVGLGRECLGYSDVELIDEQKEAIRIGAANACKKLQELKVARISVEGFGHSESAAEGAGLAVWQYQELREKKNQITIPQLELYDECGDWTGWNIGLQKAAAQNLSRQFMDTPANLMTPTTFAQNAVEVLCKSGVNCEVKVQGWAETQKMNSFLSVAKGSCEAPIFLELSYYGANYDDRPVVMIGSGVTFDSGGVCLKSCKEMEPMRGSMNGAACLVAAARAIAALQIPINLRGLIPLTENMPGCSALKPGDVVQAINGKKIRIEDTDNEARLIIADTLWYSQNFWPRFVIDIGTLNLSIQNAIGVTATGAFTNSDNLWQMMKVAACHTGDRVWRFPLWNYFTDQVLQTKSVDILNNGRGIGGAACRGAAFLREFVPCGEWMHLDTRGVIVANGIDHPYLMPGMSGRPTRTLIEFLAQMSCVKCD